MNPKLLHVCNSYLKKLCVEISERSVGSNGNREATRFFRDEVSSRGWETEMPEFTVMDWQEEGATLQVEGKNFPVGVSPYSLGCTLTAPLVTVSTVKELASTDISGKVLLLRGNIAGEQLMPKNFVFYNPEAHQHIYSLLEAKQPGAIITATGRNAALAGGEYPFPMFEDGDFNIPSVFMTEEVGKRLAAYEGKSAALKSVSRRLQTKACNVIARKGSGSEERIVITAHIDAKKGTPGALDNATGIVVLLLLAEQLKEYSGEKIIELTALNGEDYYAASGQMHYLAQNQGHFHEILLNINIDGAGFKDGNTAFSLFNLPPELSKRVREVIMKFAGIIEGPQWFQGDHSIFIQQGCPALAVTSQWFLDNIDSQNITHTPRDSIEITDGKKVVEIVQSLHYLLRNCSQL